MADPQQADEEFGRRLAAARGYSRESLAGWAERIGKDRGTLRRYELGQIEPDKRAGIIQRYEKETKLPSLFFVIDFDDLPEMVAAWRQVQDEEGTVERLLPEQERDETGVLPDDPSESQT